MGLSLEPDTDVLDGTAQDGVGDSSEGSRCIVLPVRQISRCRTIPGGGRSCRVPSLESAACEVEATELDRDLIMERFNKLMIDEVCDSQRES